MNRTGRDFLESIRDGRVIYVGSERVRDQTTHPAFADCARTYAALYDLKADPANRDLLTYEEDGERYAIWYLKPRTAQDLVRRNRAHHRIARFCHGLMGRTPDAGAGNLTGLAMRPEAFEVGEGGNRANLQAIWEHLRKDDIFPTYAVVPPPGARNREYYQASGVKMPALRAVRETDRGVVVDGMKMLATGAAYAHEVLVGNIMPLAPDQKAESITCVIPLNLPGLTLFSRPPLVHEGMREFDAPLTRRFDESDCMLVFREALVPWEKVIVHNNAPLSRNIYVETPAHVISNHQSTVRFREKLRFLLGVASLITRYTGARDIPAVRETLARLAAMEAGYAAMVEAQVLAPETYPGGYMIYNRRYLYAALHWAMENHSQILDIMRELMGGGQFQFPASIAVADDPELEDMFHTYWTAGADKAVDRMKLFKLAWDVVGSEHASRATSYEKFFVGPAHAVRNYNFVNAPWDALHADVEALMASYGTGPSR